MAAIATESAKLSPKALHSSIAKNLAVAGEFQLARQIAERTTEAYLKETASDAIMVLAIASQARTNPLASADITPIENLGHGYRQGSALYLLALDLLGQQPYTSGGGLFDIAELEQKYLKDKPTKDSATLKDVLSRWPEAIASAPAESHQMHWINYANVLFILKDLQGARNALKAAVESPSHSNYLLPIGLIIELDGPSDAELVARRKSEPLYRLRGLLQVAKERARIQQPKEATEILDEISYALEQNLSEYSFMDLYQQLVKVRFSLGSSEKVHQEAEKFFEYANQPHPIRAVNLVGAIRLFNDVGMKQRANEVANVNLQTLMPAISKIGGDDARDFMGISLAFGEALSDTAVELYRAGDKNAAAEILNQLGPRLRRDGWEKVFKEEVAREGQFSVLIEKTFQFQKASGAQDATRFLLIGAIDRISKDDNENAGALLELAKLELSKAATSEVAILAETLARAANITARNDLVQSALELGARASFADNNRDNRTLALSNYAALQSVLLERR